VNFCVTQGIGAFTPIFSAFGFPSLYATLVCVACSQLEKLRAALLDIRQTHAMSEQGTGGHEYSDRQTHVSEEVFQLMRKQLNVFIRHHQDTKRCDSMLTINNLNGYCCPVQKYFTYKTFFFRFMAVMEDTLNIPLCGMFIILLLFLCLDAFSMVTVNILAYF
jgi:hypothetical protein